jgi:hypothetical protein
VSASSSQLPQIDTISPDSEAHEDSADSQVNETGDPAGSNRTRSSGIPIELLPLFSVLTGEETSDEWGKIAGQYVRRVRRATNSGPTFLELFDGILSDLEIWAAPFPSTGRSAFNYAVALHWRRGRWIRFTHASRSLMEGPASIPFGRQRRRNSPQR